MYVYLIEKSKPTQLESFQRIRKMEVFESGYKNAFLYQMDMDYPVLYSAKEIYFSLPFETTSFIIDSNSISS